MIYVAEITAWNADTSAEITYYFSSTSWVTGAGDTPAHTAFLPRILQPALLRRDVFEGGRTFGKTRVGYGELVLANPDGELDDLLDTPMDGRRIVIRAGEAGDAYPGAWSTILTGTMDAPSIEWSRLALRVHDRQTDLDKPIQATLYAGNNSLPAGLEGVEDDLKDQPKPLLYGKARNISPPCVNTSRLIYQVHDGAVSSVDAVYDQGLALTAGTAYTSQSDMETNAPSSGYYRVWAAGGYFRLGGTPAGQITADATQGASAGDRTAAQILKAMALKGGIASGDINSSDVTALDTANSAVCGLWIDRETSVLEAMDLVANSVGAWYGFDAAGDLRMARLEAPSGSPVAALTSVEILRFELKAIAAGENNVPAQTVTIQYQRNWTVQTSDIAGAVTDARRGWLAQEWRASSSSDAAVATAHPLAQALTFETYLDTSASAATEASRRLTLYKSRRDRASAVVRATAALLASLTLGAVIRVTLDRFGYDGGKLFRIVGMETDLQRERAELELWG